MCKPSVVSCKGTNPITGLVLRSHLSLIPLKGLRPQAPSQQGLGFQQLTGGRKGTDVVNSVSYLEGK